MLINPDLTNTQVKSMGRFPSHSTCFALFPICFGDIFHLDQHALLCFPFGLMSCESAQLLCEWLQC